MNSNNFLENILSVPVWGFNLPNFKSFNQELERFAYWLKDNTPPNKRSNFLGWQSSDNLHLSYSEGLSPLITHVTDLANDIVKDYSDRIQGPVALDSLWVNINSQYSFNANHIHSGALSGVYYVKTPPDSGRLVLVNPANRSEASRIRVKNYGLTPEEGACIIFPSWLEHYVEPNKNTEDRISISFNIE